MKIELRVIDDVPGADYRGRVLELKQDDGWMLNLRDKKLAWIGDGISTGIDVVLTFETQGDLEKALSYAILPS